MGSRSICPGCDSDDADFRRAMRAKRACPHCRLPAAAITAVWYVRAHNIRPRQRTKDQLDQLLDRIEHLENDNSRLTEALQARSAAPTVVEQLQAALAVAQTQLEQLKTENARLTHELRPPPAPPPSEPSGGEEPTPDLVEQLRTLRQDMTGDMDTVIATAQKLRSLLDQPALDMTPVAGRARRRTGDRTDRVFMPGDPVHLGADDAHWLVTRTYTSNDPWVKIQHSVRTHEHRAIRVRVLVKHQRAIAGAKPRPRNPLGARVRELRVERSLTQNELATLCGLTPARLSRIESGHRHGVLLDTVHDIATALDVHPADLFRTSTTGDPAP